MAGESEIVGYRWEAFGYEANLDANRKPLSPEDESARRAIGLIMGTAARQDVDTAADMAGRFVEVLIRKSAQ